jgi:hypothetical protein
MKNNTHFRSYLAQFFLEREMFQTKVVEKILTHILCSVIFTVTNIQRSSGVCCMQPLICEPKNMENACHYSIILTDRQTQPDER